MDKTREFFTLIESLSLRNDFNAALLPNTQKKQQTQFTKASLVISRNITELVVKLQKLAAFAKNKSLFQDQTANVNELIGEIKQELELIKRNIAKLKAFIPNQGQNHKHSSQVVDLLQLSLTKKSNEFTEILKIRKSNLKEQKQRQEQFVGSVDYYQASPVQSDTIIDMGFSQLELLENQNNAYLEQRDEAIDSIESTIAQLGQVYSQFASVLQQQREMVQRIDDNTLDTLDNVQGAHSQLLKYYDNMSGNRALMLKTFGVVLTFFLMFVLMT
jgi:syntaxin 5